jgi:hypothetical protein
MPETKECPMCGATMRIKEIQNVVHVPGNVHATARSTPEWICPECDYFEEMDEERT